MTRLKNIKASKLNYSHSKKNNKMATKKRAAKKVGAVHHKRRKRTVTRHAAPRRRRVSGIGKMETDFATPLAVVGGLVGARFLQKMLPASIKPQTQGIIMAGIGAAGFMMLKNKTAKAASTGVFASGTLSLLQGFGVINGITTSGQNPYVIGAVHGRRRKMGNVLDAPAPTRRIGAANIPFVMGNTGYHNMGI